MTDLDVIRARWSAVTAPSQARADVRALLKEIARLETRERRFRDTLECIRHRLDVRRETYMWYEAVLMIDEVLAAAPEREGR